MRDRDITPGDAAWIALLSFVSLYDLVAVLTGRDTLSQSFARALDDPRRKWPTIFTWAFLTAHLLRVFPKGYDPIIRLTDSVRQSEP